MTRCPISDCATCHGTGKIPSARISYGPCPVCMGGETCPRCYYQGGMDEDDNGEPKCRFCGWSAALDRQFAKDISA